MKNFSLKVLLIALVIGITGCATPTTPTDTKKAVTKEKAKISKKFQFYKADLSVTQLIDPDANYHTDKELERLLNEKLHHLLKQNNLLSTQTNTNFLMINATYERRFVGDKTSIPSSSLSYPSFKYTIDIKSHSKTLVKIEKKKFSFKGNLALNKQVIAKKLNKKTDEIQFINALADSIFKDIKNLQK